ncbi:MAG: DUF971 domain-containing protein [bacterium]|nr:DUF971 domain-containing protein [bacterium]
MAEEIPEPLRIEVIEGEHLEIAWADGATTRMTGPELRAFCQCAECRERPPEQRTVAVHEAARIVSASLVGSYAISFVFAPDGHSAGIFLFADLHRVQSG